MNDTSGFSRKAFFQSLLFSILLLLLAGTTAIYVISDKSIKDVMLLTSAAQTIDQNYPDTIDWDEMFIKAREAMFEKLDRYSSYYQDRQFDQLDEELSGGYTGIGISVLASDSGLLIMSVRENGPAAEAGLLTGDIITQADSVSLAHLNPVKSSSLLRGEENTKVLVTVYRPSADEYFNVSVERRRIPFLHIPFAGLTKDSIVYIRLFDFDPGATEDLKAAIDSLVVNADTKPKGLILDLQGNPGGLFIEAYETADLFLDEGNLIVGTNGRSRWKDAEFYSSGTDITGGLPMAVLVDGGSASSAEIVSGALQTANRALLIGDTTFGKGLVQGFVQFPNGDGLKLTVSRYFFDDSIYLNDFDSALNDVGHGLVPDLYIESRSYNYFQRELENSLILGKFAALYQEELIADYNDDSLEDRWIDRLAGYCKDQKLLVASFRTEIAEELLIIAELEKSKKKTIESVKRLLEQSRQNDLLDYYKNKKYIKNRLAQIAFQRKFGDYRSYKDVLLKTRPEIDFAVQLLLENQ